MIYCIRCDTPFKPFHKDQCDGLACTLKDGQIGCGYGSKFDMNVYDVLIPDLQDTGAICDGCVDVLDKAGLLKLVDSVF